MTFLGKFLYYIYLLCIFLTCSWHKFWHVFIFRDCSRRIIVSLINFAQFCSYSPFFKIDRGLEIIPFIMNDFINIAHSVYKKCSKFKILSSFCWDIFKRHDSREKRTSPGTIQVITSCRFHFLVLKF